MKLSDFIMLKEEEKKLAVLHRGILVPKELIQLISSFYFKWIGFM